MSSRTAVSFILALSVLSAAGFLGLAPHAVHAQVLVGDPFITSYENWVDPVPERGGNWRINLGNDTIMETSDLIPGGNNPPAATNNGSFVPSLLVQDGFTTPDTYDLSARMFSSDDDGFGLVFGYQDTDNYFRVMLRAQTNGNLGGTTGLSVQGRRWPRDPDQPDGRRTGKHPGANVRHDQQPDADRCDGLGGWRRLRRIRGGR